MSTPTILDSKPFSKHWWTQPSRARFHSVAAINAGVSVKVELRVPTGYYADRIARPFITWTGTKEQFVATGLFPDTVLDRIKKGRRYWIGGLSGQVNRLNENFFEFIIQGALVPSKIQETVHIRLTHADQHFLNFRDKVMAGLPREDLGCES